MSTKIVDFLNIVKSVVVRSYQLEFAGVDLVSLEGRHPGLYGDTNSPVVVYRAALFTEIKDSYFTLPRSEKNCIDISVKYMFPHLDTMNDFIDFKVGGEAGEGACLQDATHALLVLHNKIVKNLGLEDECNEIHFNPKEYINMPKIELSQMFHKPAEKNQEKKDSKDAPEQPICKIS